MAPQHQQLSYLEMVHDSAGLENKDMVLAMHTKTYHCVHIPESLKFVNDTVEITQDLGFGTITKDA